MPDTPRWEIKPTSCPSAKKKPPQEASHHVTSNTICDEAEDGTGSMHANRKRPARVTLKIENARACGPRTRAKTKAEAPNYLPTSSKTRPYTAAENLAVNFSNDNTLKKHVRWDTGEISDVTPLKTSSSSGQWLEPHPPQLGQAPTHRATSEVSEISPSSCESLTDTNDDDGLPNLQSGVQNLTENARPGSAI